MNLDEQDAARGIQKIKIGRREFISFEPRSTPEASQSNFRNQIAAELEMVRDHNVVADTRPTGFGEEVTKTIRAKRPWLYRWIVTRNAVTRFFRWLFRKDV